MLFRSLYSGPLFTHQLSHLWIDFRGLRDAFMRDHGSDYFENSRQATYVQQAYAVHNPMQFAGYGENCWGFTACDGPGWVTRAIKGKERRFFDYVARGVPDGPDDGTIAPWAVAASLPFAPEIVAPTLANMGGLHVHVKNRYGFKASINPVYHLHDNDGIGWVSRYHFGINEGPTVLMIENYRSGLPWQLMRGSAAIRRGLERADFRGGWLSTPHPSGD